MATHDEELLIRTVGCGELTEADAAGGREVVLTGWVHRRRDLGQLIFVELRDASGRLQVVFDPSLNAEAHQAAEALRAECVIGIAGVVVPREAPNPDHPTGQIELRAERVVIHNRADDLPFQIADEKESNEEQRLKHRYVDLRRAAAATGVAYAAPARVGGTAGARRGRVRRDRDSDADPLDPRGGSRLSRAQPRAPGRILRACRNPRSCSSSC